MRYILLAFFLISTYSYGDELSNRAKITDTARRLFLSRDYDKLTYIARDYLYNQKRTASGKWKLDLFYRGIGKTVKNTEFNILENIALDWIKKYPKSEASYISYAKILIQKAWHSRGSGLAQYTSPAQWKNLKKYIKKAKNVLLKHKKAISNDPEWYVLMFDIARGENWDKKSFFTLVDEAIDNHPYYNPIYYATLFNMQPLWGNFSKEEIEKVAQKILSKTKSKSKYAMFYWVASQYIFRKNLFASSDVNWTIMSQGIDEILDKFPAQWNINHFAYYSCLAGDKEKTKSLLVKIIDRPNKYPWIYGIGTYKKCLEWANSPDNNNTNIRYIKELPLDKLEDYMAHNTMDKPLFVHFSIYRNRHPASDVIMIDDIAQKYHDKINFVSINMQSIDLPTKTNLFLKYHMKRTPFSMIVHHNKIIERLDNALFLMRQGLAKYRKNRIADVINNYLLEPKTANYFEQFKEAIVDKASYFNSEQNIRDDMGTTYLLDKKGFKATAAAVNIYDDLWAYGCALKEPSQNEAIKKALAECEINRKKYKVKDKCKLHMIGNIYIYEKTQNEIQKILKTF